MDKTLQNLVGLLIGDQRKRFVFSHYHGNRIRNQIKNETNILNNVNSEELIQLVSPIVCSKNANCPTSIQTHPQISKRNEKVTEIRISPIQIVRQKEMRMNMFSVSSTTDTPESEHRAQFD